MPKLRTLIGPTFLAIFLLSISNQSVARDIYLNGTDISGARHQVLKNVTIRIDGQGNVFIEAPHYQVNQENTFIPLSKWQKPKALPEHKTPGKIPDTQGKVPDVQTLPTLNQMEEKEKSKVQEKSKDTQESEPAPKKINEAKDSNDDKPGQPLPGQIQQ